MIGGPSVLAGVSTTGLLLCAPFAIEAGVPDDLGRNELALLAVAGITNVVGLLCIYAALRVGKVSIVAPIASTEGAIAAVIAIVAGETIGIASGLMLATIAVGVIGFATIAVPLLLLGRLQMTRAALPLVVAAGFAEVIGFVSFAIGARHGIAISAVLASQFAAMAAISAYFLFGERVSRVQLVGVAVIAIGVAVLTALQA